MFGWLVTPEIASPLHFPLKNWIELNMDHLEEDKWISLSPQIYPVGLMVVLPPPPSRKRGEVE